MLLDIGGVDHHLLAGPVAGVEADIVEDALHHRHQAARADILHRRVHLHRDIGDRLDGVVGEFELTPSVCISATYCLMRQAFGSVRMRRKSSRVSARNSTRIGSRRCSSGSRSDQ